MLAQEALDGVETAARDGDRPTRYSVGGKLGRGKRDKSRQFQRSAVEPRIRVHSSERPTDRREKGGIGIARCEIDKAGSMRFGDLPTLICATSLREATSMA